jgi:hypothetical protein
VEIVISTENGHTLRSWVEFSVASDTAQPFQNVAVVDGVPPRDLAASSRTGARRRRRW